MTSGGTKCEGPEANKTMTSGKANKDEVLGSWPCKINGCDKQFAREADLKRHQRTTKTHSMPGFCCSQCDATFTRTDALKRHVKSRHTGSTSDQLGGSSLGCIKEGSGSSGCPSGPPDQSLSSATASSGPLKYYRPHTVLDTASLLPPPSKSTQTPLASSTNQENATATTHNQQKYYSPYYRRNSVTPRLPTRTPRTTKQRRRVTLPATKAAPKSTPDRPPDSLGPSAEPETTEPPEPDSDPITRPLLDFVLGNSNSTTFTEEQVIQITKTAINAVFEAEAERLRLEGIDSRPGMEENRTINPEETIHNMRTHEHSAGQDLLHDLIEGESTIFNPADILTQQSLASPPSSL